MKKYMIFYIIIILLSAKGAAAEVVSDELADLANLTAETLASIENWQVTLKETRDKNDLLELVSEERDNGHEIKVTNTKEARYYEWTNLQSNSNLQIDFKLIVPNHDYYKSELTAVISGTDWDDSVNSEYFKLKEQVTNQYFSQNLSMFACLTTVKHDILQNAYIKQIIKNRLNMTYIKEQDDVVKNVHKSIVYGYTDLWPNEIRTGDKPTNFQMVIRQDSNDGTQLTLGTPILIHEY